MKSPNRKRTRQNRIAILVLACGGMNLKEIAFALKISIKTVDWHFTHIRKTMGGSRLEIAYRIASTPQGEWAV